MKVAPLTAAIVLGAVVVAIGLVAGLSYVGADTAQTVALVTALLPATIAAVMGTRSRSGDDDDREDTEE